MCLCMCVCVCVRVCECESVCVCVRGHGGIISTPTPFPHSPIPLPLHGCRSETHSLQCTINDCRLFCVRVQVREQACLQEITPKHQCPLASQLRSRGCYVLCHVSGRRLYLWMGSKVTQGLRRAAKKASKLLRKRSVVTCLLSVVT